jgi:integrase
VDAQGKSFAPLVKERRALSDDFLEKLLAYPRYTTFLFLDTETNGLQVRVGRHRATWRFDHDDRRHGRRKYTSKTLGHFPDMRTADARQAARVWIGTVAAGKAGPGKREAVKVEVSLAEFIAHLERVSARKGKPARWAKNVKQAVRKHLGPEFGQWSLADLAVHPGRVADWHKDITDNNGPVIANQCCKILRAAYQRSAKRDPNLPMRDPCSAVEFNTETAAQTAMPYRDYPKWLEAWRAIEVGPMSPARKEFHLFGLFTGARGGEISRIRWRDVYPRDRVIKIPGSKKDNTIRIIMSAPIARILKRARDLDGKGEFVFAHCTQAAQREKLPARGHALRHSYATVAANIGIDDAMIRILQGWAPRSMAEKYLTRMVLATGEGVRTYQRKMSAKIVQLLGADPTL